MTNIFKTMASATALAAALVSSANAQDAEQWEGFYTGLRFNLQDFQADGPGGSIGLSEAFNAGVYGGYNYAVAPNVVVGAELSYDSKAESDILSLVDVDVENAFGLRGRAGYTFGNAMLYGTLGYTWADFNAGGVISGAADGFTYGAGLETMLSEKVTARFEYTRTDYSLSNVPGGASLDANTFSVGVAYKF